MITNGATRARKWMLVTASILLVFGVLAVYSASSFASIRQYGTNYHILIGHLVRIVVGAALGIAAYLAPPGFWRVASVPLYVVSLGLLVVTVLFSGSGMAPVWNGSSRFIVAGPLRLIPSDMMRFSLVLLVATLSSRGLLNARSAGGVAAISVAALIPVGLMMAQPDMAGAIYLIGMLLVMLYLAEARFLHILLLFLALVLVASAVIFSSGYQRERISGWLSGSEMTQDENFQPTQACIALGSGGLAGRGLARGRQQRGFLPEAFTDFILAVIGEETGFIGTTLLLAITLILCICGWLIAESADNSFGYLVAGGLTASITGGVLIHVGVVTKLLPTTGMPLPLVSWGGTNIVITMVSLGIIARVAEGSGR
jgi:cell division protein FtsW